MLNAAAPIGPSVMIWSGEAILEGLYERPSQARGKSFNLRLETLKPTNPILGFAPEPVAPSSLISPPDPVAAPGNGEMAVG